MEPNTSGSQNQEPLNGNIPESFKRNTPPQEPQQQQPQASAPQQVSQPNPPVRAQDKILHGTAVQSVTNAPSATQNEEQPQEKPKIEKTLRTFESDTVLAMQQKKASMAKIALAEAKKKENAEVIGTKNVQKVAKSATWLMLCLIFIGLGGGVFYYLYNEQLLDFKKKPGEEVVAVKSIIDANVQKELSITEQRNILEAILNERKNSNIQVGHIEHVFFTQGVGETKQMADAQSFLQVLNTQAPNSLVRSLQPEFMFGFYQLAHNEPFLILQTESFQSGFAGMLAWEGTLFDDLERLFVPVETAQAQLVVVATAPTSSESGSTTASTSTASQSTTTEELSADLQPIAPIETIKTPLEPKNTFEDVVIRNKDVRVLRSTTNEVLLLYTFTDPKTVVITRTDTTLREILDRMEKKVYVR